MASNYVKRFFSDIFHKYASLLSPERHVNGVHSVVNFVGANTNIANGNVRIESVACAIKPIVRIMQRASTSSHKSPSVVFV